jgi:hypothetical protein
MKKSSIGFSPSWNVPRIIKTLPNDFFISQKTTKQAETFSQSVAPPTEEMIKYLNRIRHEYPFCVNNNNK